MPAAIQARLEALKAEKESRSAESMKAELDTKMMSASVKKEEILKTRVEAATAVIEKAKETALNKPAVAPADQENTA